jgi:hypothetical protein
VDEPSQVENPTGGLHVRPKAAEVRFVDTEGSSHRFGRPAQLVTGAQLAALTSEAVSRGCDAPRVVRRQASTPFRKRSNTATGSLRLVQFKRRRIDVAGVLVVSVLESRHHSPSSSVNSSGADGSSRQRAYTSQRAFAAPPWQ